MENIVLPWERFYKNTPAHLDYPGCTMYQLVKRTVEKKPDATAYDFMDNRASFRVFDEKILHTARCFAAMGVKKGDRVTLALPNMPQALWCFYALNRLGAVPNMVHPMSAPAEIAFYLNMAKSDIIVVLDMFYDKTELALKDIGRRVSVVVARIADELPFPKSVAYSLMMKAKLEDIRCSDRVMAWKSFMRLGEGVELPEDSSTGGDVGTILYSGGTTGTTKGVLLSNDNFNATALQTIAASGFELSDGLKMLSVMPMFHGFGLGIGIHTALAFGFECVLLPQFSIPEYAKVLRKKKPHIISGVPTLFEALLRAEGLEGVDLSFLMGMFSGGDSLSIELKRKVDAFLTEHNAGIQIREGYGTTECVTASCLTPIDYNREGSIGIPFPDTYYKIVRVGGTNELLPGEEGEICLRGPSVMTGYLDNEEETKNVLREHGDRHVWLHTGDLGFMDEDGFVYFRQRIKRMIISSGYNIYPSQIENILDSHEKVLISCVIGVKDVYKMQKVKAFVVLAPGLKASEELKTELLDWCGHRVAKYAMPYDIEFRAELPKTLVGKVAYRLLEEEEAGREAV